MDKNSVGIVRNAIPFIVGLATGVGIGWVLCKRELKQRLEEEYAEIAYQDIQEIKDQYQQRYKEGLYSDPTELAEARGLIKEQAYAEGIYRDATPEEDLEAALSQKESIREAREIDLLGMSSDELAEVVEGVSEGKIDVVVEEEHRNLFDELEKERENLRSQGKPYIISAEEFGEIENYDKVSLSYFEEDDVLMDEDQKPIPVREIEKVVGRAHLARFGDFSEDPNLVFVRNELILTDFEIAREEGSYTQSVIGVKPEPPVRTRRTRPRPSDLDE